MGYCISSVIRGNSRGGYFKGTKFAGKEFTALGSEVGSAKTVCKAAVDGLLYHIGRGEGLYVYKKYIESRCPSAT